MGNSRNARINATRSRTDQENDALELKKKGYSFEAIGDLLGISGSTAKTYVQNAKISQLEQQVNIGKNSKEKVIPIKKEA